MKITSRTRLYSQFPLTLLLILLATSVVAVASAQQDSDDAAPAAPSNGGVQPYEWAYDLPAKSCPWSSSDRNCHRSSPALADMNGDGRVDIVVATNNGHIVVVDHDGDLLWDTDISQPFGMSPDTNEITSSPAVADIDADGKLEVVVGTGTLNRNVCTQGGLIVLDHDGKVEPGWPYFAYDNTIPPAGCRDTIYASPALGDLDNDGDLEIVAGGFDKRIYAWHHTGELLSGFPPHSYLRQKYPDWQDLNGRLGDTIWSSPALADLDNDGYLDIIIGADEGNVGDDWHCPYRLPPGWLSGYCGGSIYALNRFGQLLPGFPRYIYETVQSTPAVADLNGDDWPEIIVGTGSFYYVNSPDHPTDGFRLYVLNRYGADFPGWQGGKWVGGPVPASPSVGDITGDGRPEIIVGVREQKKVHAYTGDGQSVDGFPAKPIDPNGQTLFNYDVGTGIILADYDGDNRMEILFNQGWSITVVDGDGQQITAPNFPNNSKPIYLTDGLLLNNPAVGDLDNDGHLELVVSNSKLYLWELTDSSSYADWPSFKRDASGTSYAPGPAQLETIEQLFVMHDVDDDNTKTVGLLLENDGGGTIQWSASNSNRITLVPSGGTYEQSEIIEVQIDTSGLDEGEHDLGEIVIEALQNGQPVAGSPRSIPIKVYVGEIQANYLPIIMP